MTTILDPALDLSLAPLTNTPLTSSDTTFTIADLAGDIANFPDPGVLGYYAWVWARDPSFSNVGDANRAGFAERVRVTARDLGLMTLTVTRGASPIDLNASGVTYWLVAPMNAAYIDDIDERLFDFAGGNLTTTKDVVVPTLFVEQIDLAVTTPGVGLLRFLEDTANGTSAVTLQSPAALAGDVAITLLDALPGSTEFLQISSAGVLSTVASSASSLDASYDVGRIITADAGPVEAAGAGGFLASHSAPVYGWETTGAEYNFRALAGLTTDIFEIQRGDQDADISDDAFETIFSIAGATRRIGVNNTSPQDFLHVSADAAGATRLRLQAFDTASDVSVFFNQAGSNVWEAGYDDSAGGFVVGRLTFTNPALFVMDGDGRVGINTTTPSAQFEVFSDTVGLINTLINVDVNAIGLVIDSESTSTTVLDLRVNPANMTRGALHFDTQPILTNSPLTGDVWFDGERYGTTMAAGNDNHYWGPFGTSGASGNATIATGVLPVTRLEFVNVLGEGGSPDILDTITETPTAMTGERIYLLGGANAITVAHGTGNIYLDGAASKVLNGATIADVLELMKVGNDWLQVSFSNNG